MAKFNIPEDEYMIKPATTKKEIEAPIITRAESPKKEEQPSSVRTPAKKGSSTAIADEIMAVRSSRKKAFTYYLPIHVSEKLNEVSKRENISQSKLIDLLVTKYL